MLNEYFEIMVDIVFRYRGILDKYIGDAIMAVFGAPISGREDSDNAVRAAIDMMTALRSFNLDRAAARKAPINIGIGISTDEVLSGNIGSVKRMDYTVIGDGVNLASRLEGANKYYGTQVLISESTYHSLKHEYIAREIDLIRVRGKTRPVSVYQILDYHNEESFPHVTDVIDLFREGLSHYRRRAWREGAACFARALELNRNDPVSGLYLERCSIYQDAPPGDDWDGVWVMQTK